MAGADSRSPSNLTRGESTARRVRQPASSLEDQPRERFYRLGIEPLADRELLALVMRTGTRTATALHQAETLLGQCGGLEALATFSHLESRPRCGIGPAKLASLVAAVEIGRRLAERRLERGDLIRGPGDVHRHFFQRMRCLAREHFVVILLDGRNRVMTESQISQGTLTASLVHPREVFRAAIRAGAAAIVLVHNHPSGDATPSEEDVRVTARLVEAGEIVGIRVVDHVVVAEHGFHSFQENGQLG